MPFTTRKLPTIALVAAAFATFVTMHVHAQKGADKGEWRTWGGDLGNTRYSPLDQITADNFNKLQVAWRFKMDNLGPRPEYNLESTPLMVNGVLYSTGGTRRSVVSLDASTGELKWVYGFDEGPRAAAAPRVLSGRGLAYWTDGREERIFYVTIGYQLVALDAKTGRPVPTFGKNGMVDLRLEDDQVMDLVTADIGLHATPLIGGNTIIIGAAHSSGGNPKSKENVKGFVRGYDVKTGKRIWIFHTIPSPGEYGNDTWEKDSWSYTGNTGVWAQVAIDEELGRAYIPVEMPTGDYYGGHRPGANLFSDSIVCVDLKTGKRVWHYQLVHHDIWDRDIPSPPVLANITVNGRTIRAVAVPTKQAFLYVFDRVTGEPVWPIEERPVPKGNVPGEWYAPTQPFPTKPPAFDRQGFTPDDLLDLTPELKAEAEKVASRYKMGGLYEPPVLSQFEGPLATLTLPEAGGGANWQGGAFDPETHMFYIYSVTAAQAWGMVPGDSKRTDMAYVGGRASAPNAPAAQGGRGRGAGGGRGGPAGDEGAFSNAPGGLIVQGLPLVKPPWGRITAIDLNKGDIAWQIPHGETPDFVRNHPALKGVTIPKTGRTGRIGVLVTKTLVMAGEGGFFTTPGGRRGAMLRAYDKASGKEVGAVYMSAPQTGSLMTYMLNGKQYVVVPISGGNYSDELVAYRLPE
jgi:quinoprotein glucose dehydrogenase